MVSVLLVLVFLNLASGFGSTAARQRGLACADSLTRRSLRMEYIPDGMSKAQWDALKKKEKDDLKGKNLGAVGITKFKSRSFEAFQKSGGKNLFPVDPNAPDYVKPYMQRKGGMADGSDLVKKGISISKLVGGAKPVARNELDAKYDELEGKGLLKSSPFELPWSNSQAAKLASAKLSDEQRLAQEEKKKAMAAKKTGAAPAPTPAKNSFFSFGAKKATPPPPPPAPEKTKRFGFW